MTPRTLSVLIADDHELVRRGLRLTIAGEEDMRLAGEAADGAQALRMISELRPDVVLMDAQMPGLDGIAALRRLRETGDATPVLMLTSFGDDAHLHASLRAGASGYLLKDTPGDALIDAIRDAAAGKPVLHPDIARRLMQAMPAPADPLAALSDRERDVLAGLARGRSNKEIALELGLTELTVKGYVSSVLGKLGVDDRTQAALLAVRYGLGL